VVRVEEKEVTTMRELCNKVAQGLATPLGAACIIVVIASSVGLGISVWHGFRVCTLLVSERNAHETWMQGKFVEHTKTTTDAIHTATLAIEKQTQFNETMRQELLLREQTIVETAKRIETVALALEWRAREFQKAALSFYRAQEKQAPP
jgi:hypothetical protein